MKNVATLLTLLSITASLVIAQDNTTCLTDSAALVSSDTITAPYEALRTSIETDVTNDFMQFCSIVQRKCTVNVADYSADLQAACLGEGGQIVLKDATLDCTGNIKNVPIPGGIDVEILNIPGCVGASCDPDNLPSEIDSVFAMAVEQVATEVETAVAESADITCGASTTEAGGSGGRSASLTLSFVTVVFLVTVLLSIV